MAFERFAPKVDYCSTAKESSRVTGREPGKATRSFLVSRRKADVGLCTTIWLLESQKSRTSIAEPTALKYLQSYRHAIGNGMLRAAIVVQKRNCKVYRPNGEETTILGKLTFSDF